MTTARIAIRRVRPDEWPRWREVRLRMLRDDAAYFSSRYEDAVRDPDERWERWISEAAAGEAKVLYCAVDAGDGAWLGTIGGFVRVDPSQAQLISMWVAPEARGRGVARALITELGAWATERGCAHLFLFVQEANAPARALYAHAGFAPTGDRTPVGGGRTGFKLVLSAPVASLVGGDGNPP